MVKGGVVGKLRIILPGKEELYDLHIKEKQSATQLAEKYHVCLQTVKKWLKFYGIDRQFYKRRKNRGVPKLKPRIPKDLLIELNFNQQKSIKEIARHLNVTRNLVRCSFKDHQIEVRTYRWNTQHPPQRELLQKLHVEDRLSHNKIAQRYRVSGHVVKRWCNALGVDQKFYSGFNDWRSSSEKDVADFLRDEGFTVENNSRNVLSSRKELDVFIPSHNLAIEYCGLFWHDENKIGNKSHLEKLIQCERQGISLITIFEDEWLSKPDIVKSILLAKLGKFERVIGARNCELSTSKDVSAFLDDNHLQGRGAKPWLSVSLSYGGDIVGAMTFAKHHRGKDVITLNRLCFRKGMMIQGGAHRLFRESVTHLNDTIVTWSDRRWSQGTVYKKLGFIEDAILPPDYSYHNNKRVRKSKQSMKKSATGCPPEITEHEWCKQLGWSRIWDCGKVRWVYKKLD